MDASTRSFHVYGKTESGATALKAGRDGMSTSARRLLILVDGQRTVGELVEMLGTDAVEMGLAQLQTLGCVEFLRRFPGADDPVPEASVTQLPAAAPESVLPAAAGFAPLPAPLDEPLAAPFPQTTATATVQLPSIRAPSRSRTAPILVAVVFTIGAALALGAGWAWRDRVLSPANLDAARTVPAEGLSLPASASVAAQPPTARPASLPSSTVELERPPQPKAAIAPTPSRRPDSPAPPAPSSAPAGTLRVAPPAASAVTETVPRLAAATSLRVRTQVTPEIPKPVLDRGITRGHVVVVLHVDPEGAVQRVELLGADPPEVYDAAMAQAFGKWTFDPLGIPGRMTVDVDIRPPK